MNSYAKRKLPCILITFLSLFLLLTPGDVQAIMLKLSLEDLTSRADVIVQGTVIETISHWNEDRTTIHTEVLVWVEDVLKGELLQDVVTIIVLGGTIGDVRHIVSDMPIYAEGEQVLVFLCPVSQISLARMKLPGMNQNVPLYKNVGHFQGKLDIDSEQIQISYDNTLQISLEEVKSQIRYFLKFDKSSFSIELKDSTKSFVSQSRYVLNNQRWQADWPNVRYVVHNSFTAEQNSAVRNAANTWSNAGAKFSFAYGGTHTRSGGNLENGVNEIVWDDLGTEGTLGRAAWYMRSVGDGPFYIVEADFALNTRKTFSTSTPPTANDMESVALHEFGHWLSLGHSSINDAVMWFELTTGTTKRILHGDDIAGIKAIYGVASSPTLPSAPGLLSPANGSNAAGTSITFSWSAATGNPSKYHLQLSSTPNFSSVFANNDNISGTSLAGSGFPNAGTTYYWRVRAFNSSGWGSWSSSFRFDNGTGTALPSAPGLLSPANGSNAAGTSITFSWSAATGNPSKYHLQLSSTPNFSSVFANNDNISGTSLAGSGFPNAGTTYYWRVRAFNSSGWGSWSTTFSFINSPGADLAKSNRIFDWLESLFPAILPPQQSQIIFDIIYRYYPSSQLYLATYMGHLYFIDADFMLHDLGPISAYI